MVVPTPGGDLNPLVMLAAEILRRRRDLAGRRRPGGRGPRLRYAVDQAVDKITAPQRLWSPPPSAAYSARSAST